MAARRGRVWIASLDDKDAIARVETPGRLLVGGHVGLYQSVGGGGGSFRRAGVEAAATYDARGQLLVATLDGDRAAVFGQRGAGWQRCGDVVSTVDAMIGSDGIHTWDNRR